MTNISPSRRHQDSPSYIGSASFNTKTRVLTVWDNYGDGERVKAWVWNMSLGGLHVGSAEDANGANGTRGSATLGGYFVRGDRLEIEVCRQNGTNGSPHNCGYAYVTAD